MKPFTKQREKLQEQKVGLNHLQNQLINLKEWFRKNKYDQPILYIIVFGQKISLINIKLL